MRRRCLAAATVVVLLGVSAPSAGAARGDRLGLDVYSAVVGGGQLGELNRAGVDVSVQGKVARGFAVELILNDDQRAKLEDDGIGMKLARVKGGQTVKQFAIAQAESGFNVWRSWDEPGGIRDQMYAIARDNPQLVKLVRLGTTLQGREILALKLTQGARGQADGSRPAVLYSSTQHAREWISTEVNRRLMRYFVDRWRANDKPIRDLLQENELWFVLVANPRRLRVHVRRGAAVAQEPARQRRRRTDDDRRRRRPEPQLPEPLQVRRGGLLVDLLEPDVPRPRGRLGARDPSAEGPARPDRLLLPGQLALGRRVAAVRRGLAGVDSDGGRPDLLRAVGQPRRAGDRRLPSGTQLRRALRHKRRDDGLCARGHGSAGVDPGAVRGLPGLRVRLPGRRRARAGGVRAQPAVCPVGRPVGERPGRPGVLARHRDQALLHQER
jgi:hypothetical protein